MAHCLSETTKSDVRRKKRRYLSEVKDTPKKQVGKEEVSEFGLR